MSDQEDNRQSANNENIVFFIGAVVIFNIILVFVWVVYIFREYANFTRFHNSQQQFVMFDDWMKHSVWWDIALGIVLNFIFMGYLSEWLRKFRPGKENPSEE